MKQILTLILSVTLLFLTSYGSEIVYSYLLKDNNLEEKTVLELDYNNLKTEYENLLRQNELWKERQDMVTSKVILRDVFYFFDEITILKGKNEGVNNGDIVYNESGFIGTIKNVKNHSSIVELLGNQNTKLSVKIQNSYGILQREGKKIIVKNITSKEEIKEGSLVVTSAFAGTIGDIPVATVQSIQNDGIEQILVVTPVVDFENLNYVMIGKKVSYD